MMTEQDLALNALGEVDFNWTLHIKSVWRNFQYDVDNLHEEPRRKIISELNRIKVTEEPNSPHGRVLVGTRGVGKTHLLNAVRSYAFAHKIGFILVDMTDVHNFWETVLQGYVSSLQQIEVDNIRQYQRLK